MSLRARTSVLDEWWRPKVAGNEWIWASLMLTGISGWQATSECGSLLFLLVTQSVIYSLRLIWRPQLCCESGVHSLSDCYLCVDLVGLTRQLLVYFVQFCNSQ